MADSGLIKSKTINMKNLAIQCEQLKDNSGNAANLNTIAGVTAGTVSADKVVIADSNRAIDTIRTADLRIGASGSETQVTATGAELNLLDGVTATTAELNYVDVASAGTVEASKAVVVDGNKHQDEVNVTTLAIGASGSATAVAASAAELNRAADVSARLVNAGATLSATEALHDGKTVIFDQASGSVIDLPAATGSGARMRFVVGTTVTSNSHILRVAASTDDEFVGHLYQVDTDTSDTVAAYPALDADGFDTITMDGTTTGGLKGDILEVEDIASGTWAIKAHTNANGTVATPFSSSITS